MKILLPILIPFIGTSIGSALVFLLKDKLSAKYEKIILGFSSGIMIAASIWSLILPAITNEMSIIPVTLGLMTGLILLIVISKYTSKITKDNKFLLALSITIHNIPEGMAVGIIISSFLNNQATYPAVLALSIGIGIQNIPEGSIISMPLKVKYTKFKSFMYGVLSGIVEPIASIITILLTSLISPLMPFLLTLAAGAMIYVVIKELIPEGITDKNDNISSIFFFIGFIIMMILDVLLG